MKPQFKSIINDLTLVHFTIYLEMLDRALDATSRYKNNRLVKSSHAEECELKIRPEEPHDTEKLKDTRTSVQMNNVMSL